MENQFSFNRAAASKGRPPRNRFLSFHCQVDGHDHRLFNDVNPKIYGSGWDEKACHALQRESPVIPVVFLAPPNRQNHRQLLLVGAKVQFLRYLKHPPS